MSDKKIDGGAAFPRPASIGADGFTGCEVVVDSQKGMSYRRWLAGQALSNPRISDDLWIAQTGAELAALARGAAMRAWLLADAVIEQESK